MERDPLSSNLGLPFGQIFSSIKRRNIPDLLKIYDEHEKVQPVLHIFLAKCLSRSGLNFTSGSLKTQFKHAFFYLIPPQFILQSFRSQKSSVDEEIISSIFTKLNRAKSPDSMALQVLFEIMNTNYTTLAADITSWKKAAKKPERALATRTGFGQEIIASIRCIYSRFDFTKYEF